MFSTPKGSISLHNKFAKYKINGKQVVVECNSKLSLIPYPSLNYKYVDSVPGDLRNDYGDYIHDLYQEENYDNLETFIKEIITNSLIDNVKLSKIMQEFEYDSYEIVHPLSETIAMYGNNYSKKNLIIDTVDAVCKFLDRVSI